MHESHGWPAMGFFIAIIGLILQLQSLETNNGESRAVCEDYALCPAQLPVQPLPM
jgi:hypothetical protein